MLFREQKFYVLYDGHDHKDGVFTTYRDTDEEPGIYPYIRNYGEAVHKSFLTLEAAQNHHREAKETGVIGLLKRDAEVDDVYIVTKGIEPGVYTRRGLMMKNGLGYRGGEVQFSSGKASDARRVFSQWEAAGHVRQLSIHRPFAQ
ncbi:hypothetical protein BT96DRAFT_840806 [Gymnopus androsaceus JB14]|uniref:Ribonuclease H1 N-terminal domain-containing protein n=1 Tax=Gymnopus androsaceus JB14 TaxID=1447944 RepID=A0A6A4GI77_9AGAR|nr:hypothetical protein BT96DRAFT_840806 [Gymnopus androsaceus JB14]